MKDLGEAAAIQLLTEMVTRQRSGPGNAADNFKLLVDAGDDAAAWRCGVATELFTTDTAVDGVHFTRDTTPWRDLGWKIMAANVSDIAAMGGLPLYALVTLGLPPDLDVQGLKSLYGGLLELGNSYGVAIVGGDIVRSPIVFVTVSLTGFCDGDPILRSSASRGDSVAITGYLGSSAGGLEIMSKGLEVPADAGEYLRAARLRPEPRIDQGRILCQHGVRAAIDVSDGLIDDMSKLCKASGVAASLEAGCIPVHPSLKKVFPHQYLEKAFAGGEDYELLFTAPGELMERVIPLLGPDSAVIGKIVDGEAGQVEVIDPATGQQLRTPHSGWDHFRIDANESPP